MTSTTKEYYYDDLVILTDNLNRSIEIFDHVSLDDDDEELLIDDEIRFIRAPEEIAQFVVKNERKKFIDFHLRINSDFVVLQNKIDSKNGFFCCKFKSDSKRHSARIKIAFNKNGKQNLTAIHNYLKLHF